MEASRLVRDGDEWEKGDRRVKPSRQAPTRKANAAVDRRQNNKMLIRQCPPGIAQPSSHHVIAVPAAMQNRVTKIMSVAPPLGKTEAKEVQLSSPAPPPCS